MRARSRVGLQRDDEIRPTCGTGTHMRVIGADGFGNEIVGVDP